MTQKIFSCFTVGLLFLFSPLAAHSVTTDYRHIKVIKVYDGDTITVVNGEKVRFIGIDCPETHENQKLYRDAKRTGQDIAVIKEMGKLSTDFTRQLLLNKNIQLEFDVQKRDRYGRLLAYVYLPDGTFVNARIVEQGLASPMTVPPNVKHAQLFKTLYAQARSGKRGLWALASEAESK